MSAFNLELVRHILVKIIFILRQTENITKEEVINDRVLCYAVVWSLEIMGEASKNQRMNLSPQIIK